jgi:DNA-binding transcriptional MerR regulator
MSGSLAVMPSAGKKRKAPGDDEVIIPDKLYFRIGEVASLSKLPAYVLRFWETEFPQLKPTKGSTGQRMYRRRDVENILHIKRLLYDDGYTIAGAREKLKAEARPKGGQAVLPLVATPSTDRLKRLRQEMRELLQMLNGAAGKRR